MVCSASVDILHMGMPKMHVIDHKLFSGPCVCYKGGQGWCNQLYPLMDYNMTHIVVM